MSFILYRHISWEADENGMDGTSQFALHDQEPSEAIQAFINDGTLIFKGYANGCETPIYDYTHLEDNEAFNEAKSELGYNHTVIGTYHAGDALYQDKAGDYGDGQEPNLGASPVEVSKNGTTIPDIINVAGISIEKFEQLFTEIKPGTDPVVDACKHIADAGPVIGVKPFGQA